MPDSFREIVRSAELSQQERRSAMESHVAALNNRRCSPKIDASRPEGFAAEELAYDFRKHQEEALRRYKLEHELQLTRMLLAALLEHYAGGQATLPLEGTLHQRGKFDVVAEGNTLTLRRW